MSEKKNGNDLTYSEWYRKADAACSAVIGLGLSDLPDACYADAWEGDEDPAEFAKGVVAQEAESMGIDPGSLGLCSHA